MRQFITVREAAAILKVSVARVHQYINEPCPDCGTVWHHQEGDEEVITFHYGPGCDTCAQSGRRLPTHGRFGVEGHYGYKLDLEQVKKLIDSRAPGYPKGRKRRKKWSTSAHQILDRVPKRY